MAESKQTAKQALQEWASYVDNIRRETPVETGLSLSDIEKK